MKYSDNIVTHREKNGIEYLTFNKLDKYSDKIMVEVTLRRGGVSSSIYRSLNFRNLGRDKIENVIKNVEKMCEINDINIENVYKANQAHTDNILVVDNKNKNEFSYLNFSTREYDAYIIKEKNTYNFVTTADCNPIVVYDTKNNIIANIHAGWKGVLKRIYLKAVEKMVNEFGSKKENLIVCIGPSIRKCCFSSEEEKFKKNFTNIWENEEEYITYEENSKKFYIDLIKLIKSDFINFGILEENIDVCNICTACNNEDFYSYRCSKRNNEEDYATFSTWVGLK